MNDHDTNIVFHNTEGVIGRHSYIIKRYNIETIVKSTL